MSPAAASNGVRPTDATPVDLDAVIADRAAVRQATLAGNTYSFRPLNLVAGRYLTDDKVEECFKELLIGDEDTLASFLRDVPVRAFADVLVALYGPDATAKPSEPPPGSAPTKPASKPSKRTSSRKVSRSSGI